jgi:DNA invertase Pin-like site-specific DNA recombinase
VTPLAYSYIRFSHPDQAKGDSIRRQTEATAGWCERNGVRLDTSLALRDEGRSAFKRDDFATYALAGFLRSVEGGRVPKGSYLIVENLDRLSRESEVRALNLFTSILMAGVNIVQLTPREQVFTVRSDLGELLPAIIELSRGHSESKRKQTTIGGSWRNKRERAAADGVPLTHKLPGWVQMAGARHDGKRWIDGRLVLIPDRAEVVRRIFSLARTGLGVQAIAQRLNAEGVPCWRRPRKANRDLPAARLWNETAVYFILKSRAAVGEFQPCQGSRCTGRGGSTPVGDPISNYFPPVVSADEYDAALAGVRARAKGHFRGRRGKHINLFSGLIRSPEGNSLTTKHTVSRSPVLIPVATKQGVKAVKWVSFPAEVFEAALLSRLAEVTATDVFPESDAANRAEADRAKLAEVKSRIARIAAALGDDDDVPEAVQKLRELRKDEQKLRDRIADAEREAKSPVSDAWGEFKSLAGAAKTGGDEVRLRIRTALRRAIDEVRALIVPAVLGRPRLAVAQVWFVGGRHRDYLIYCPGGRAFDPEQHVKAFAGPGRLGDLDLRDPKQAAALEKVLAATERPDVKDSGTRPASPPTRQRTRQR